MNKIDIEKFSNFIDTVNKRIEKLEVNKNYQIDENRKISKRIDELERLIKSNELSENN